MNWDRGLRRITLVLSIVGAFAAAYLSVFDCTRALRYNESVLANERRDEFSEFASSRLINEWKRAKALGTEESLWTQWTRENLEWSKIRSDVAEKDFFEETLLSPEEFERILNGSRMPKFEEIPAGFYTWATSQKNREYLRNEGWETAKGKLLPLQPIGIWIIEHDRRIKDLEETVSSDKVFLPIATAFYGFLAFAAVWVVFGLIVGLVWPVCQWISRGFREDKQKDGQKANVR